MDLYPRTNLWYTPTGLVAHEGRASRVDARLSPSATPSNKHTWMSSSINFTLFGYKISLVQPNIGVMSGILPSGQYWDFFFTAYYWFTLFHKTNRLYWDWSCSRTYHTPYLNWYRLEYRFLTQPVIGFYHNYQLLLISVWSELICLL